MSLKDDKQQNTQIELDFSSALTGEAREAGREGAEPSGAMTGTDNSARIPSLFEECSRNRLEPPCTDPYARWCGRGRRVTAAPMPINVLYVRLSGRDAGCTSPGEIGARIPRGFGGGCGVESDRGGICAPTPSVLKKRHHAGRAATAGRHREHLQPRLCGVRRARALEHAARRRPEPRRRVGDHKSLKNARRDGRPPPSGTDREPMPCPSLNCNPTPSVCLLPDAAPTAT